MPMKKIIMFTMGSCPYCRRAHKFMEELYEAHPEYRDIPIEIIDETQQPQLADQYDYYYVPTYYIDGIKYHEGIPTFEKIEKVFKAAYEG